MSNYHTISNYKSIFVYLTFTVVILRIMVPLLVFIYPIYVLVASVFLDWIDGALYYQTTITRKQYNYLDKSLDLWWYTLSLIYSYFHLKYFVLLFAFYIFRLAGHVVFYVTNKEKVLILFPNFYEFVLVFLLLTSTYKRFLFFTEGKIFWVVLIILFILKILNEMLAHILTPKLNNKLPVWLRAPAE